MINVLSELSDTLFIGTYRLTNELTKSSNSPTICGGSRVNNCYQPKKLLSHGIISNYT